MSVTVPLAVSLPVAGQNTSLYYLKKECVCSHCLLTVVCVGLGFSWFLI